MKYRKLGSTEIDISEIGFGAWGIGGITPGATSYGATSDAQSIKALQKAFECGINFYDTANVYGAGHSEQLIAKAFASNRDQVIIATKAGMPNYKSEQDFSPNSLLKSLNGSLKRLNTDYVDLFQLHNPSSAIIKNGSYLFKLVEELKKDGKIRAFGISVKEPLDGVLAINNFIFDALQVNFNLLDQRALECGLLTKAHNSNVAIIARTPLCFGFLSNKISGTKFDSTDHRSLWPTEQVNAWSEGAHMMSQSMEETVKQTAVQFALRFCLSFSEITTTIPGMLTAAEVEENIQASDLGKINTNLMNRIIGIYKNYEKRLYQGTKQGLVLQ